MFDYGCGRGEDVEFLKGMGFQSSGWDPVHFNVGHPKPADVINLGYVINVIEIPQERSDTLKKAYDLARRALIVSAQVGFFDEQIARSTEFLDGYLTTRNTFQKYFEQHELADYIRDVLGQEPYAAGIGVYYVFRDSELEGHYCRRLYDDALPSAFQGSNFALSLSADTMTAVATKVLELGRLPEPSELPEFGSAIAILSASEAWLKRLSPYLPDSQLKEIAANRKREFTGLLLGSYFSPTGKLRMCDLSESQRADLRCFFGSYVRATTEVELVYRNLVDRFETLGTPESLTDVVLSELPNEPFYLWKCLEAALELNGAELLRFCPSSLRVEWSTPAHAGLTYGFWPSEGQLVSSNDEPTDFNLFARRRSSENRPTKPRGVPSECVEKFMLLMLSLGRMPTPLEYNGSKNHWSACVRQKLWSRALQLSDKESQYEDARRALWESILFKLGTANFHSDGRAPFKRLDESFQADIKAVFGSFAQACAESDSWMRRMGDCRYVESEVRGAGRGKPNPEKGLSFHVSLLRQQPLVLQMLIETARLLALSEMPQRYDVIRVSYTGDTVKFYDYYDFESDTPRLRAICKVMFRKRRVFGKDYPAESTKLLNDKAGLMGETAG